VPAETHVEHGPIGRDEIFELVRDRLADILEIDPSTIAEGQSFADDLEADSLALIELVEALEEELGERTVGLPHRRRGPRGPQDGPRRRRLHPLASGLALISAPDLDWLLDRLDHRFHDAALLELALTHRSWCAEHPGTESNERLEFLGDAVLDLAVTEHLYHRFPDRPEGELAPMRAAVVSAATLARAPDDLGLGRPRCVSARVRRQREAATRPSILADGSKRCSVPSTSTAGGQAARRRDRVIGR
jgi:acyl carrier protein